MAAEPVVRRGIAALVVGLVALTSCTSGRAAPQPEDVPWPRVDLPMAAIEIPAELSATAPASWGWSLVAGAGSEPPFAVGVVEDPGEAPEVGVWRPEADGTLTASRFRPAGEVWSVAGAASAALFALAGTTWDGARSSGFVALADADRRFAEVPLPEEAAAVRLTAVTVAGEAVVALGEDLDENAWAVLVDAADRPTPTVRTVQLPATGHGDHLTLTGVASDEDRVVVTAEVGRPGAPRAPQAFVSDDGGVTWDGPAPIDPGVRSDVHGVAWTGSGFVATGSRFDDERRAPSPAAWSSPDGATWTPEDVPLDDLVDSTESVWLGAPMLGVGPGGGAAVIAVVHHDYNRQLVSFAREGSAPWRFLDAAEPVPGVDATGMAWRGRRGDAWFLTAFGSGAQLQRPLSAGPEPAHDLVADQPVGRVESVHALGDVVGAVAERRYFEEDETGWRTGSTAEQLVLDGTALRSQPWGPEGLARYSFVLTDTDPVSGTTVLLGSGRAATTDIEAVGWWREGSGPWRPVSGLGGHGFVEAQWLGRAGDRWFATGQVAESANVDDDRHGQIWTSRDGATWEAMAGDLAAPRDSLVERVCALPDGLTVAVGWTQDDIGDEVGTLWRLRDDRWERSADGALGSSFTWCAAAGDAIVLGGTLDGRVVTWRTTDGVALEEVDRLPDGVVRGKGMEVDGGLVAAGHLRTGDHEGPVVWFSADGEDWSWAPVPGRGGRNAVTLHTVPDGVVVTYSGARADQAWLVKDPGAAIRAAGPGRG